MADELLEIALNQIKTKSNYRKSFNDKSLKELAQSIRENGVIEPIIVQPNRDGFYLVAGERRVRAAGIAGLVSIPAIVKEISDGEFLKIQLVENIQREGVHFMDEARAIRQMRDDLSLDIGEIVKILGKSEAYVYYQLKVTQMSPSAQDACNKGEISKSVAWQISKLPNKEHQTQTATDLRRSEKSNLITERTAKQYIEENFGDKRVFRPKRNYSQKIAGNDFQTNWKKYLVNFTGEQFEHFKRIVKGRTDTHTISEAVEVVMIKMTEAV